MKTGTRRALLATCSVLLLPATAVAADTGDLLKQKRCNACHDAEKALIGPPWKAIALRYRADRQDSIDVLARKIVAGGGGAWGVVPMVPNEHVSAGEARAMAQWILDQATR
jgi:cytochrome c